MYGCELLVANTGAGQFPEWQAPPSFVNAPYTKDFTDIRMFSSCAFTDNKSPQRKGILGIRGYLGFT
jgi:hypothetical protein